MSKATFDETEKLIDQLQNELQYLKQFDLYHERLKEAGVEPEDVDSLEMFRELPFMRPRIIAEDYKENPPFGSLNPEGETVVRSHFTPSPYIDSMMPVPYTETGLERQQKDAEELFRNIGLTEDDVLLNTASFSPYPAGWLAQRGAENIGSVHLASGPGDTGSQVEFIRDYDVTVIFGFPSFLEKIASEAEPGDLESIRLLIATGEPFTAIEGYRDAMIQAYGGDVKTTDLYGLAEFGGGSIGYETQDRKGMQIPSDKVLVEIINPETGELVERGEKGEIVITSLTEHAQPVLRMRTGDLSKLAKESTPVGEYMLPDGVFGRADNMRKTKGVKVFPSEIQMYLAGVPDVDPENVQFKVTRPHGGTDDFSVTLNGDPDAVDEDELRSGIRSVTNISVDELTIDEEFELDDQPVFVDERT